MITSIIFILLITFAIGLPLSLIIINKLNSWGRLGVSFLLGTGMFTWVLFLLNLLGMRINHQSVILSFILISFPLVLIKKNDVGEYFYEFFLRIKNIRLSKTDKIIIFVIGLFFLYSFINTLYWPVNVWDSLTLYDFRARVFAQSGSITELLSENYYLAYPLYTSLLHTIVYLTGGDNPQFIYSIFYLSLGLSFYGAVREFIPRNKSLLFTLILISIPSIVYHSFIAYTNLPYTVLFSLGAIYLYIWGKRGKFGYLVLSALLIGLSSWVRTREPFWIGLFLVVILISLYRRKYLSIPIFLLIFLPIQQSWEIYGRTIFGPDRGTLDDAAQSIQALSSITNVDRWIEVLKYLYANVIVVWGAIFPLFGLALLGTFIIKRVKKLFLIYFIVIVLLAIVFVGSFFLSIIYKDLFLIGESATRLSMVFYPLFVYSIAMFIGEWNTERSVKNK